MLRSHWPTNMRPINAATLEKLKDAEAAKQDAIDAAELARSRSLDDAAIALARRNGRRYLRQGTIRSALPWMRKLQEGD